jgi:hypothetical protein
VATREPLVARREIGVPLRKRVMFMQNEGITCRETQDGFVCVRNEQFPVDTKITTVRLEANVGNEDLLRAVVMNDQATSSCSARQEYHYGNANILIDDVTSFTMHCSSIAGTQEAVDAFVGSRPLSLSTSQSATWSRSVYSPSGARKRLYKAVDPDDNTKWIGLLIEQDTDGTILHLTWYKTADTRVIFRSAPPTLTFELVTDQNGAPSLDPNDIGGWAWYHATTFGGYS